MPQLALTGVCNYNGVIFNLTTQTLELSIRPVWDRAGRTIIYSTFRLTLTMVISAVPTDAIVQEMISRLTQPAAGLRYNGRGVGDIQINLGGAQDAVWGPKPQSCTIKPYGGGNGTRITWTVEFAIPTCGDARFTGPMEFNYATSIDIDKSGYTNRVYKGYIVIAQTRPDVAQRFVAKSADEWRESINPPLLQGFRRIPGVFDLSEDKCRMDFSIRDEQMGPNPLPPGIIEVEAEHSYTNDTPGRIKEWTGSITATYELSLDATPAQAIKPFGALVQDRLAALRGAAAAKGGVAVVPMRFTVADTKIYDKTTVHLAMQYRVAGASLSQILVDGGLWRPVPGATWKTWATSLKVPLACRGWAQIRFVPGEDQIVDLCGRLPPAPPLTKEVELSRPKVVPTKTPTLLDLFKVPAALNSWITYDARVRLEADSGAVVGTVLPGIPLPIAVAKIRAAAGAAAALDASNPNFDLGDPVGLALGAGANFARVAAGLVNAQTGGTFVQQRTVPQVYVFLSGYAMRAAYPVPMPVLLDINGSPLFPVNRPDHDEFFEQRVAGNVAYPVYEASWNLRFCLPLPAAGPLTVPPNPIQS